jgi:hypothetical protein
MSQGTRSVGRTMPAGPGAAPKLTPQAEQNRAPGLNAEPQEGQKPEPDEVIAAI